MHNLEYLFTNVYLFIVKLGLMLERYVMLLGLFKLLFKFGGIFLLVVVGLYMDKLLIVPKEAIKEIFSVGFPWNLIILTTLIYFTLGTFSLIFKGMKRIL